MSYLVAALVVGVMVTIHELGHLVAARLCGIPISRFSVGFGPKLVGVRRGDTSYWLAVVPLGGYVLPAIDEMSFRKLRITRRVAFALGGPAANAVAAYLGLFALGVLQFKLGFGRAALFATEQLLGSVHQLLRALATVFAQPDELSGIVGIVAAGGAQGEVSLLGLVSFSVVLNLNLLILNLLPIPPLDGGRILLWLLERVSPRVSRFQQPAIAAGIVVMLALIAYATATDIARLSAGILS